jgi:hypothetical protein
MEPVHEHRIAFIKLAPPGAPQIDSEVDARIEIQQDAAKARWPSRLIFVLVKQVAQNGLAASWSSAPRKVPLPLTCLADPAGPHYGPAVTKWGKEPRISVELAPSRPAGASKRPD